MHSVWDPSTESQKRIHCIGGQQSVNQNLLLFPLIMQLLWHKSVNLQWKNLQILFLIQNY